MFWSKNFFRKEFSLFFSVWFNWKFWLNQKHSRLIRKLPFKLNKIVFLFYFCKTFFEFDLLIFARILSVSLAIHSLLPPEVVAHRPLPAAIGGRWNPPPEVQSSPEVAGHFRPSQPKVVVITVANFPYEPNVEKYF